MPGDNWFWRVTEGGLVEPFKSMGWFMPAWKMEFETPITGTIKAAAVLATSSAYSDDRPVVIVSAEGVTHARLEVHVGEIVSWRSPDNRRLRIELDVSSAQEIVEREGQVRGIFRNTGEHSYVARPGAGLRESRGVIVVKESSQPPAGFPDCAPESSEGVCFDR